MLDRRTDVVAVHFKESPPHSAFDWHDAPEAQYVITLAGTLEFTTRDDETFIIHPGDVLVAADTVGAGHKWRLIDNEPWRLVTLYSSPARRICSRQRRKRRYSGTRNTQREAEVRRSVLAQNVSGRRLLMSAIGW